MSRRTFGGSGASLDACADGVAFGRRPQQVRMAALLRVGNRAMRRKALRHARKGKR